MSDEVVAEENKEQKEVPAEETAEKPAGEAAVQPADQSAEQASEDAKEELQNAAEEKAAEEQAAENKEAEIKAPQVPLAPRCVNPVIGRKVFFVNPPLYVENYLTPALKQNEYEAYIIKDYKYTKNALKLYPDALCFIFIDDEMSYDGWFNFILSFQHDEKLKTIFVGLMSAMIPGPVREKFMMNLSLPGGFIMLNEVKGTALIENVIGILELNGAKGKRKYIRLDCGDNVLINGYFANQTQLLQVTIANISSLGFTCYFPKSYGAALVKNMVVPSFSITLGRRSVVTPSVVFDVTSVDENNYFAVLLFLKQVGAEERKVIKNFIFDQLEDRVQNLIYANPPDIEDYFSKEEVEEAEDAEEIKEEGEDSKKEGEGVKEEGKAEPKEEDKDQVKEEPEAKAETEAKADGAAEEKSEEKPEGTSK